MATVEHSTLLDALVEAPLDAATTVYPYSAQSALDVNEFLFFLKPPVTRAIRSGSTGAWQAFLDSCSRFEVELQAAAILPGLTIRASRLIRDHYGVIDAVSESGENAFDRTARDAFRQLSAQHPGLMALGAHQYLE